MPKKTLFSNLHQNLSRDEIMDEERQGEMLQIFKKIEKILLDQVKYFYTIAR